MFERHRHFIDDADQCLLDMTYFQVKRCELHYRFGRCFVPPDELVAGMQIQIPGDVISSGITECVDEIQGFRHPMLDEYLFLHGHGVRNGSKARTDIQARCGRQLAIRHAAACADQRQLRQSVGSPEALPAYLGQRNLQVFVDARISSRTEVGVIFACCQKLKHRSQPVR